MDMAGAVSWGVVTDEVERLLFVCESGFERYGSRATSRYPMPDREFVVAAVVPTRRQFAQGRSGPEHRGSPRVGAHPSPRHAFAARPPGAGMRTLAGPDAPVR